MQAFKLKNSVSHTVFAYDLAFVILTEYRTPKRMFYGVFKIFS